MNKIILASNNKGKLKEISAALAPEITVIPQAELNIGEVEETGLSFVENALIKARYACEHSGEASIADDSGIVVPSLQGEPGIYSARYAGRGATDKDNVEKLLTTLKDSTDRSAYFACVMVYMRHAKDPLPIIAQGIWHGSIALQPQGELGFGYDPIFWLEELKQTAAMLPLAQKNQISHRGQALKSLIAQIKN